MGPPLSDDIWTRRGISLLWDADALAAVCTPQAGGQPAPIPAPPCARAGRTLDLSLVNDSRLVVAGLESAIDALPPDEAVTWLEQIVYPAIVSYQEEVAGGGDRGEPRSSGSPTTGGSITTPATTRTTGTAAPSTRASKSP